MFICIEMCLCFLELTFELTMAGGSTSSSDGANSNGQSVVIITIYKYNHYYWTHLAETNGTIQQLERALSDSQETVIELQCKLESLEYHIALIKHEKNLMMRKFEEQMNTKDTLIASMHSQLEDKSNTVAQLVHKLHQMQRMLQRGGGSSPSLLNREKQFPILSKDPLVPPENIYRTSRITRRTRRSNVSDNNEHGGHNESDMYTNCTPVTESLPSVKLNIPHTSNTGRLSRSYDDHTSNKSPVMTRKSEAEFDQSFNKSPSDKSIIKRDIKPQYTRQQGHDLRTNPTKTILPPISTNHIHQFVQIPLPSEPKPQHNRRFRLAKTQGLTSAPCSLRLSNCSDSNYSNGDTSHNNNTVAGESEGLLKSPNNEGRLLVKHETKGTMFNHLHHH